MFKMSKNILLFILCFVFFVSPGYSRKLRVVTTLSDYAYFTKMIGKDKVSVFGIVRGDQDAHFIRPKPSFSRKIQKCDVLVATGLDLELWLPAVVNKSGNNKVRSGMPGYIAASQGIQLLEKPEALSRIEGGLHKEGNPHLTCSPLNMKKAAGNIAIGLSNNDPDNRKFYMKNLKMIENKIDVKMFGKKLVKILGGDVLTELTLQGKLFHFLESNKLDGKKMIDFMGGWTKKLLPLRGKEIVSYHKNWIYFFQIFGMIEAGTVEPKPGIPPTPRHFSELIKMMKKKKIKLIIAANYFDRSKVLMLAGKTEAKAVMLPIYVKGESGIDSYFDLVDYWVNSISKAFLSNKRG